MTTEDDIEVLIEKGFLEKYLGPDGEERLRPTPYGALQQGDLDIAAHLQACKDGKHEPNPNSKTHLCWCGSTIVGDWQERLFGKADS